MGFIKHKNNKIIMPYLEQASSQEDREMVAIFLHYFRDNPIHDMDRKIYNAIEKAAKLTGYDSALVAKILVECGLRSSRRGLPQTFLDYVDVQVMRFRACGLCAELHNFWQEAEEDPGMMAPVWTQVQVIHGVCDG